MYYTGRRKWNNHRRSDLRRFSCKIIGPPKHNTKLFIFYAPVFFKSILSSNTIIFQYNTRIFHEFLEIGLLTNKPCVDIFSVFWKGNIKPDGLYIFPVHNASNIILIFPFRYFLLGHLKSPLISSLLISKSKCPSPTAPRLRRPLACKCPTCLTLI